MDRIHCLHNMYNHVYLSPHLDDAVLSCGGRIWQQAHADERVLVVTVFAGGSALGQTLSSFAHELHARWGHSLDAADKRRKEDLAALSILGAKAVHWPYADCVYRQTPNGHFPYASEEALWGNVHPTEANLVKELKDRIAELPLGSESTLYIPLGVGHHVDHQIVHRAVSEDPALSPLARVHDLIYYEDYPYAIDQSAVRATLVSKHGPWQAEPVTLSEEALQAKIAAVACYRSQLSTFWKDIADMESAIRTFARQTGDGEPAERYWRESFRALCGARSRRQPEVTS